MRKCILTILLAMYIVSSWECHAQGTLYLSNLSQPSAGSATAASDAWLAEAFSTGSNPGGYSLGSLQLLMNSATGSPNGFSVSIYDRVSRQPGDIVANLTGPDPASGGLFTYTGSGVVLQPSSVYYVVVTAWTPAAQGFYPLSVAGTSSYISSDNWNGSIIGLGSPNGTTWNVINSNPFQFAITATPVPEPGTCALLGLGLAALGTRWKKRRAARPERL